MRSINDYIKMIIGEEAHLIGPLLGGMMNESWIIEKDNKKYILYLPTDQANEMVDREKEYEAIQIANELNITNKSIYFDVDTGIKVNEMIDGCSLDKIEALKENDYKEVASLLKKFHSYPKLLDKDYCPFIHLEEYEKEALTFIDKLSNDYYVNKKILLDNKEFLEKQKKTICHNDAQRSNIVLGKDNKYYLLDYEFVGNNDPIYDIATFGNNQILDMENLLKEYYENPTNEQYKRLYLWRIYISLQWYLVALIKHYRNEGVIHNINFLKVSEHFLENANEAINKYLSLKIN